MPLSLNSSLLSRSALQSSSRLWGLVLACGLAALAGSRGGTGSTTTPTPPRLSSPHMSVCKSTLGSFSGGPLGVTRSQTALNGPKRAVQINNLLRLESSHQEQHSVKCQQQTP